MFRISTFGESHGPAVGVVIDGCPPGLEISDAEIQRELDRRRPGQSRIVTQRKEADRVEILSGVQDGVTLGTAIGLLVRNEDQRSRDYDEMREKYRPSHADFAYDQKFGVRAVSGGGRASARETIARVAAGAIAKKWLAQHGISVLAWVESIQDLRADIDPDAVTLGDIEANIVRCPDAAVAEEMIRRIEAVRKDGDSIGGTIRGYVTGAPVGWGDPVFDKLEADLAKAMLSLPACKGFELGGGFPMTERRGSEVNDHFYRQETDTGPKVATRTNFSGGINGGISNGMPISFRVAFKPTATIMHEQPTVNREFEDTVLAGKGRHDPCVLPRAVPMVDAMTALVLIDAALRHRGQTGR